ncbi:MAG TPA: response regulator transcription factor [Burkholderiales bacterium]|nr:response regulator transcription factor [Burkholderiales bacterium]
MIKVIIADDHELVREGIKRILRRERGIRVVAEAASVAELLGTVETCDADVLILDVNFPARSGLDALVELSRKERKPAVVMLTVYPEDRFALAAFKAGALAYVSKASAAADLVSAVRSAAAGERHLSPVVVDLLAHKLSDPRGGAPHENLSAREAQILSMIGAGKPARRIATELSIGVNTVNTYRARILKKMRMRTSAELIRYAIERGLAG